MAERGYVLVADVLGFSGMIRNTDSASTDQRIAAWVDVVSLASAQCAVPHYQLVSDTVFAAVPPGADNLAQLVRFARTLLERGLSDSFPVRGGIALGEFTWGQLIYGRAVIAAHVLESNQQWIGVTCEPGIDGAAALWESKDLITYVPPMKRGPMQAHPVVNWNVPAAPELTALVMNSNATREGETLDWEIGSKLGNTLHFGCYKTILENERLSAAVFHGPLPMQLVNEVVRTRIYSAR